MEFSRENFRMYWENEQSYALILLSMCIRAEVVSRFDFDLIESDNSQQSDKAGAIKFSLVSLVSGVVNS